MWLGNRSAILLAVFVASSAPQDSPSPASLIKDLQAADVNVRRDAATRVQFAGRPVQRQALPALIELLKKENDGQVRLAVLDTLTTLGPDAASAAPVLVEAFHTDPKDNDQEQRHQDFRAALALAAIGKPAVDGLRTLLKQRKEWIRSEAVMALGRIGPEAAPAVPDLVALLPSASERIGRTINRSPPRCAWLSSTAIFWLRKANSLTAA